eukprot:Amastigsp_a174551_11.p3 type:complete len:109 gc:universal Amastigsp_a174551_11:334-660(+)
MGTRHTTTPRPASSCSSIGIDRSVGAVSGTSRCVTSAHVGSSSGALPPRRFSAATMASTHPAALRCSVSRSRVPLGTRTLGTRRAASASATPRSAGDGAIDVNSEPHP